MPFESVVVTLAVVAMFIVFGAALAWSSSRARTADAQNRRHAQRPAE